MQNNMQMTPNRELQRFQASIDALHADVRYVRSILSNQGGSTAPPAKIGLVQCISGPIELDIEQHIEQHVEKDSAPSADSMRKVETDMVEMRSMLQDIATKVEVLGEAVQRTEANTQKIPRTLIQSALSNHHWIAIAVLIGFVISQQCTFHIFFYLVTLC